MSGQWKMENGQCPKGLAALRKMKSACICGLTDHSPFSICQPVPVFLQSKISGGSPGLPALPRFPYCPDGLPPGVRPLQAGPLVHPAQPQPQPPDRRVFTVCRTAKNTMMARAAMSTMSMSFIITSFWSVSNGKWQMGNGDGRCRPVISQVTG